MDIILLIIAIYVASYVIYRLEIAKQKSESFSRILEEKFREMEAKENEN